MAASGQNTTIVNEPIRWKIVVTGRVQGVGYRYSAAHRARELDITGSVRNLPDGNVCIEAQGAASKVAEFYQWCQQGPPMAHVISAVVTEQPLQQDQDFRILR